MVKLPRKIIYLMLGFALLSILLNVILIYQSFERNRVIKVVDGDSFQTKDGRRIRLLGIDAPEKDMCFGEEAGEKLNELLLGKRVRLKHAVTDDYGRILAIVIVEDFDTWIKYLQRKTDPLVNRVMVREGLARFGHAKGEYYDELLKAERTAKTNQKGIYSAACRTSSATNCLIKGNIRGGKKVYHLPNCPNYQETIIDESFGDRWFCKEEEAQQAGFQKASGCD